MVVRIGDIYSNVLGTPSCHGDKAMRMNFRGFLYFLAKALGDVNAVKKGKVGRRILRRGAGKLTGRGLGKLFK